MNKFYEHFQFDEITQSFFLQICFANFHILDDGVSLLLMASRTKEKHQVYTLYFML